MDWTHAGQTLYGKNLPIRRAAWPKGEYIVVMDVYHIKEQEMKGGLWRRINEMLWLKHELSEEDYEATDWEEAGQAGT